MRSAHVSRWSVNIKCVHSCDKEDSKHKTENTVNNTEWDELALALVLQHQVQAHGWKTLQVPQTEWGQRSKSLRKLQGTCSASKQFFECSTLPMPHQQEVSQEFAFHQCRVQRVAPCLLDDILRCPFGHPPACFVDQALPDSLELRVAPVLLIGSVGLLGSCCCLLLQISNIVAN